MRKINLQKLITPTLPTTALTYLVSFLIWMGLYFVYKYPYPMTGVIGNIAESILPSQSLAAYVLSYGIVVLNSMVMAQMNNRFSFIRTRTFMPTFIYLFISTCWLPLHGNYLASIAAFFILIAVFMALGMYKNPADVEKSFLAGLMSAVSAFLVPEFVFLMLAFWVGYIFLKCFSIRVFFSSIFGFMTPWVTLLILFYFFKGHFEIIPRIQGFFYQYSIFKYEDIPAVIYVCSIIFILSASVVQMISKSRQDIIQTRNELSFFKALGSGILLLFVFRFSNFTSYVPLMIVFYSIFTAYTFTLIKNTFNSIMFIVLLSVNFLLIFYLILVFNTAI